MIKNDEDFVLSTEYERFALSQIYPLMPASENPDELDIRGSGGAHHSARITLDICGGKVDALKRSLVPLAFASAWKILDLYVELCLYESGKRPNRNGQWAISQKKAKAAEASVPYLTKELWGGVCEIYGATTEHRHCMVHRRASYTVRGLEAADKDNKPLATLTPGDMDAFILLAQLLANTVVKGRADNRTLQQLRYLLSRLERHIDGDFSGGVPLGPFTLIKAELVKNERDELEADFAAIHAKKQRSVPHGPADVLLDIPGEAGYRLFARLEELPDKAMIVHLDDLPEYLSQA